MLSVKASASAEAWGDRQCLSFVDRGLGSVFFSGSQFAGCERPALLRRQISKSPSKSSQLESLTLAPKGPGPTLALDSEPYDLRA